MAAHSLRGLAWGVHRLGHALAQRPVVIDPGEPEIGVREAAQTAQGVVGSDLAAPHAVQQLPEVGFLHLTILPVVTSSAPQTEARATPGSGSSGPGAPSASRPC